MDSMVTLTATDRASFVSPGEKYQCPVCGQILHNAVQTACGHRVCEPCLQGMLSRADPASCPVGEDTCELLSWTTNTVFRDVCARREVMGMLVFCTNKQSGCLQQMKLRDLQRHEQECQFTLVSCPNKQMGCDAVVSRADTQRHLAEECLYEPQQCNKCKEMIPAVHMMQHLQEICPDTELTCPHGCSFTAKRYSMTKHQQSCPNRAIECEFRVMGCTHACAQSQMAEHMKEAATQHLEMATRRLFQIDLEKSQLSSQVQGLVNDNDLLNSRVMKISEEKMALEKQLAGQTSKINEIEQKYADQQDRLVVVESALAARTDQSSFEQFESEIIAIKESHRETEDKIRDLERRPATSESAQIEPIKKQIQSHERQIAVQDVRLAEVDLRFQILETASFNGVLLWKIRDYSRRKQDAENRKTLSLYSQPFYTSRHGYKMCARVYLNGDGVGKNSHMSLFFVVMRGEYDALLPWPFRQKVTFMLLDQDSGRRNMSDSFRPDPTSSSFKRPTSEMNVASGCPLFVPQKIFTNPAYCKDDTIFLKIIVDTTGLADI